MVNISLQEWVKKTGSLRAAAEILGIPISTLGAYCRGARYPHPLIMRQLKQRIGDIVDLDSISESWAAQRTTRRHPSRLMRGNVLINNLDKLTRLYEEAGLSRSGLHNASHFLERWNTTNVTAKEVRTAISYLRAEKKDPASVRLIHESIGASRRKCLGELAK